MNFRTKNLHKIHRLTSWPLWELQMKHFCLFSNIVVMFVSFIKGGKRGRMKSECEFSSSNALRIFHAVGSSFKAASWCYCFTVIFSMILQGRWDHRHTVFFASMSSCLHAKLHLPAHSILLLRLLVGSTTISTIIQGAQSSSE